MNECPKKCRLIKRLNDPVMVKIYNIVRFQTVLAGQNLTNSSAAMFWSKIRINFRLKPLQNKKGQKNLGYPRKKQTFYKEKDCFFFGYPKFFWPFLF